VDSSERVRTNGMSSRAHERWFLVCIVDALKYLRNNGCPIDEYASRAAAEWGRLEGLKWLLESSRRPEKDACACAASRGHFERLKWMRANGVP
jgi:hypothetical protein